MDDFLGGLHRKYIVEPSMDYFVEKAENSLSSIGHSVWEWFVQSLPDLAGYGTMVTGVCVILSTMAGRGMVRPLGFLAGGLIVAVCVLEAA
ncbi:hypothetical protein I2483_13935 [Sporosarcina sp. E16_3]|uniref:hypothetical protein n=1 Tax=Sporosarcina sp. E16_3 TaxID=2789293 RepID=UPI001A926D1C|nr:hypothetical protein [Sporosarcina sp. E16_3]MBO0602764.1 hypothetical protein [Sporosarcina sp. E16_3]